MVFCGNTSWAVLFRSLHWYWVSCLVIILALGWWTSRCYRIITWKRHGNSTLLHSRTFLYSILPFDYSWPVPFIKSANISIFLSFLAVSANYQIQGRGCGSPRFIAIGLESWWSRASLVAQLVKNPPTIWETWIWSLGSEDPLEKGTATHSSIVVWRIPWTVHGGHKESHSLATFTFTGGQGLVIGIWSEGHNVELSSFNSWDLLLTPGR